MPITERNTPRVPAPGPAAKPRRRKQRVADRPLVPLELELTGFAAGGKAIARAEDGRIVFVEYGIPGERVVAEVTESHPDYLEARTVRVLRASPARVEPRCGYFGRCGGCQLQHVDYAEQLRMKRDIVRDQLVRIGRFDRDAAEALVRDTLGMDDPWHYRNHMRFTARRDGEIGFMERGSHRFLRIDHCDIALPEVNRVLEASQGRIHGARQLAVRIGEQTGDVLVQPHLQWRDDRPGAEPPFESGQRTYTEEILGKRFRISGPAFFQVNTRQAERLASLVIERVEAVRPRVVVDAYAGVGTFAALLAPSVERVLTIEESASAGGDADVNLAGLLNVDRIVAKVEEVLPGLEESPDVVVIDPPRAGLHRAVVDAILASAARRVVYVSCGPATLARDLRVLADVEGDAGPPFTITEVQPVDMFPHTQHIECVTTLDRDPPAR